MSEISKQSDYIARIIIPYFGLPPSYFSLTLASMGLNSDFSWLLISDLELVESELPANVALMRYSWEEFQVKIQSFFDFEIALYRPYKICDFRPAFGEIFHEELLNFEFWGHADLDVVFGRISVLLPKVVLRDYDKILVRGNFSLYRNSPTANSWYRHLVGGLDYREVFSDSQSHAFDEWNGIWRILQALEVRVWNEDIIFDIRHDRFYPVARSASSGLVYYLWVEGRALEVDVDSGVPKIREGALLHLQKRAIRSLEVSDVRSSCLLLQGNAFARSDGEVVDRLPKLYSGSALEPIKFYLGLAKRRVRRLLFGSTVRQN